MFKADGKVSWKSVRIIQERKVGEFRPSTKVASATHPDHFRSARSPEQDFHLWQAGWTFAELELAVLSKICYVQWQAFLTLLVNLSRTMKDRCRQVHFA
jgi:hypothetical protein